MLGVVKLLGKYLITGETKHNTRCWTQANIVLPTQLCGPGKHSLDFQRVPRPLHFSLKGPISPPLDQNSQDSRFLCGTRIPIPFYLLL